MFALASGVWLSRAGFRRTYLALVSIFLVSAGLGWAQYWNLFNINSRIVPYYRASSLDLLEGWARRVVGTTGNPNSFAALMVLAASLALTGALWLKPRRARLLSWAAFVCFCFTVTLTASRAGLIALVLAGAVTLFVKYPQTFRFQGLVRVVFMILPIAALAVIAAGPFLPAGFIFRITDALQLESATSMAARFTSWQAHLDLWWQAPAFGIGPAKTLVSPDVDNEFLLFLVRYGIVGLAAFLGLCGSLFLTASRIAHRATSPEGRAMGVALQATFIGYIPYLALAGIYHDLQLMSLLLIVLGIASSQLRHDASGGEPCKS